MATSASPGPSAGSVTLSIAQGESPNPTATFTSAMAARMVTVGSGAAAHWKIRAPGVEALHAELYWDGAVLWARNGGSVGGTYLNGDRADDWMQVFDGVELILGRARVMARVTGPGARNPAGTDPRITAQNAGYIGEEESTMVFSNSRALMDAARSVPPPAAAPSVPAPAPAPAAHAPKPRASTLAGPTMGASPAAMQPAARSSAPSPAPDPVPRPASSEATVIRPSPYAAIEAAGGPLPAAGNRNPMPGEPQRTIAPGALNVGGGGGPSVVVSPSSVSLPVMTPHHARVGTMAPPVSATLQPVAPVAPMAPMAPVAPMASPSSPGLAPSGMSSPGSYDDPFGPMDIPPPSAAKPPEKTVAGTSPRTLVLAGVTLVIGLIAAMLPPPQQAQPRRATNGPAAEVQTTSAPPPQTNNILQLPITPPGLVAVIVPPPIPTVDAQGRARAMPPPNPQDPIKLAAEAVAANRYADAVVLYERLAEMYPEAPLFRQFAVVLRARLAAMNCPPGATGCTPPAAAPTPTPSPTPAPAAAPTPAPSGSP